MTDLGKTLACHLEALRAGGVDYVPISRRAPLPISIMVPAAVEEEHSPAESRRIALSQLGNEISRCDRCLELYSTRTQTVLGDGDPGAELVFIGEAPGADEDRQGVPFVGAAGQLLDRMIAGMGLKRSDVYIMNVLKCRPPKNATPTPEQSQNCRPYFLRQLDIVKPKFICCLGNTAAQNLLQTTSGVTRLRAKVQEWNGIPVVCTFHPSGLLRNPDWKKDAWEDLKLLLKIMGRPVPGSR